MAAQAHDGHMRTGSLHAELCRRLARGDRITYVLTTAHLPTDPLREWHGRVEALHPDGVIVSLLDEGYVGQREVISWAQIRSARKEPAASNM